MCRLGVRVIDKSVVDVLVEVADALSQTELLDPVAVSQTQLI